VNDILSFIGLSIIGLSLYSYTSETEMPGINAILPSLGTALLLYSGINTKYTTILLSNGLFRWIGNASYSIYLWHWPLIVYYKLKFSLILSINEQISLFIVSLLLGYLSWKYVEETMRTGYLVQFNVFYLHLILSLVLGLMTYYMFTVFQSNTISDKTKIEKYIGYDVHDEFRATQCFLTSEVSTVNTYKKDECVVWEKEKRNYLLLGDSHAAHYYRPLLSLLKKNETLTQLNASSCVPILGSKWGMKQCQNLHEWALTSLIKEKYFDVIILSMANFHHTDNISIKETITHMLKYTDKVVFLGRTMRYKYPLPLLLLKLSEGEDTTSIHNTAGDYNYTLNLETTLQKDLKIEKMEYISIIQLMCKNQHSCRTFTPEGIPMYFDKDHFTYEGASYILKQIENTVFNR